MKPSSDMLNSTRTVGIVFWPVLEDAVTPNRSVTPIEELASCEASDP
jgi:hypothetical protein